ncbi:MAG: ABC transporter [Halobacteriovorax sp.]|nr:ABC transporter [Halobacteriovorax sp.]
MSSGLLALLDDVSALVKVSASTLDDVPAQVAKTSGKVSGIIIDDAAVTPKYVIGLSPERELSIIFKIAKASLLNKVFILAPVTLALGYFAPWIITPILMLGGCFLCFEGYEKVHSIFASNKNIETKKVETISPEQLEKIRISSAVRTDLILSAEIVAITYSTVTNSSFVNQVVVMFSVAIFITLLVYGFVGLIVKADDFGLYLSKKASSPKLQLLGRKIVKAMPTFLKVLSYVGTAAMLLVGAEIIVHGIPVLHHFIKEVPSLIQSILCILGGLALGFAIDSLRSLFVKTSH